jgi:hypothetical protein
MALTRQTERRVLILQPTDAEVSTNQIIAPQYEWRVDGELTVPVTKVIDSLKHTDAAFTIHRVDVSVNTGGTSTYQVVIKSYDTAGVLQSIHVDDYVTLTGDRTRISIAVLDGAVPENSSLELTLFESSVGVPASDMTITLLTEEFSQLLIEREGHRILDDAAVVQAQRPDLQFAGAGLETSDDSLNDRTVVMLNQGFIGQMLDSMLSEAQMQSLYGSGWILADGRSVIGSTYHSVTGSTTAPDARGLIKRARNYTRADAFADPDGDKAAGTQTQDKFKSHTHTLSQNPIQTLANGTPGNFSHIVGGTEGYNTVTNSNTGGNETAPKSLTVNTFLKIN